jgi:hypothetical protein
MGVYHLMGLGRSMGTVTGPISYLAHRYQRYNLDDRLFFSSSGEEQHRRAGQRVGEIQAIVLFTTPEVLNGDEKGLVFDYLDNHPGQRAAVDSLKSGGKMPDLLPKYIGKYWEPMARQHANEIKRFHGKTVTNLSMKIYLCAVDRRDIFQVFERVAQIVVALKEKELWANLTGGTNVLNFALQLGATLTGEISRLYYVQAFDSFAEKSLAYTSEEGYWIEIPAMPLNLSRVIRSVLDVVAQIGQPISAQEIFGLLQNDPLYGALITDIRSPDEFKTIYLRPMWKQGLIVGNDTYTLGPRWLSSLQPYDTILQKAMREVKSMSDLLKIGLLSEIEVNL